jgi:hypothetical protein
VRVHACAREGAHNGAREKVTPDRTRRGGVVAIKEATSETVSLDALLLAAVPRAPCSPQVLQLRERGREHAEEWKVACRRHDAHDAVRRGDAGYGGREALFKARRAAASGLAGAEELQGLEVGCNLSEVPWSALGPIAVQWLHAVLKERHKRTAALVLCRLGEVSHAAAIFEERRIMVNAIIVCRPASPPHHSGKVVEGIMVQAQQGAGRRPLNRERARVVVVDTEPGERGVYYPEKALFRSHQAAKPIRARVACVAKWRREPPACIYQRRPHVRLKNEPLTRVVLSHAENNPFDNN